MTEALAGVASLALILTARCNLRCRYCYQDVRGSQALEWHVARRAIDLVLQGRRHGLHVEFVGGEPLLAFPLVRRVLGEIEHRRAPGLTVTYELVTNGLGLTERRARFCEEYQVDVNVSFDGVRAAQRLRGAGTFERLDHRLAEWQAHTPRFFEDRLTVCITVVPTAVRHLGDSIEYFLAKGVPRITMAPAFCEQSDWRVEDIEGLVSAFARVSALSEEHYHRTGKVPVMLLRKTGPDPPPRMTDSPRCAARSGQLLTVDVDGRLYGCVVAARSYQSFPTPLLRDSMRALEIGHVGDTDLADKIASCRARVRAMAIFNDRTAKYSSYGRCADCPYFARCIVCPAAVGHLPGNIDPHRIPDFQCAFTRVALAYRDRFPAQRDSTAESGRPSAIRSA